MNNITSTKKENIDTIKNDKTVKLPWLLKLTWTKVKKRISKF